MVDLQIKTKEQIRDDLLRTIKNGLINRGIQNPNVSEGTYDYLICDAIANFGALYYQQLLQASNANLPDSALGEDLIRLASLKGLTLSPAGGSSGLINFTSSVDTSIGFATGSQLVDDRGLSYQVAIGGLFNNTQKISIISTDTGSSTNLSAGATLRWVSPPPFVDQVAIVAGPDGLTGGTDAETIEGLRARLLSIEAGPPNAGENYTSINLIAEKSSSAVQKAFSYPGVYGPGTGHVAVTRAQTSTSKDRDVDSLIISTQVAPNVLGQIAEFTDITVTTVTNVSRNVSIGLDIPTAKTAIPAGPGGGWLDANPSPTSSNGYSEILAISSTVMDILNVNITHIPIKGSHVCYVSPSNWKIYHSQIIEDPINVGGNTWRITLDKGFFRNDETNQIIQDGDVIFPDAVNMDTYVSALLSAFNTLGPGQKTSSVGLLPRALRKPLIISSFPSDLDGRFLKEFAKNAGDEVFDYDYIYPAGGADVALNDNYQEPPNIFVPNNIAFYPLA